MRQPRFVAKTGANRHNGPHPGGPWRANPATGIGIGAALRESEFCNKLSPSGLLGADTVSGANAPLSPIGSPANGSGDKMAACCESFGVRWVRGVGRGAQL